MVEKVLDQPEIWSIPVDLPDNPLRNLNSYVIRTDAGNLIIDTGFNRPECRTALWNGICELNLDISKTSLFLTHLHSDHIGLVEDFVDKGCTVYMGHIDYAYFCTIKDGSKMIAMEEQFRHEGFPVDELLMQAAGNDGRRYAPKQIFPAIEVQDGSQIMLGTLEIQCIHVPGHTPGQMVLYLPETQTLFSADHILFDITPNISVWEGVPHSLADYLQSLLKIKTLPIQMTLPAHRMRHSNVYERIDHLIAHHHARLDEMLDAVRKTPGATAYEIASHVKWSARGRPWNDFSPNQKWFAVGETIAHLHYLRDENRVNCEEVCGCLRYYIPL